MVIFKVRCSVITAVPVKNETKTGWRKFNGGFIKKSNPNAKASAYGFGDVQYFPTYKKAIEYSKEMRSAVSHALDVGFASQSDIECWVEGGTDEQCVPESRIKNYL